MEIAVSPLARKLGQYIELSSEELDQLDDLLRPSRMIEPKVEFLSEGESGQECFVILDGWSCCYKLLPDGRRQIINFSIPGDFLAVRSTLFKVSDHSVASITPLRVSAIRQDALLGLMQKPRLGMALLWALSCEEAVIVEHLVNIGRRTAIERVAHFLIELGKRLQVIGLTSERSYKCPLTQDELGDALGLTAIHVNRILRILRERKLVTLSRGELDVHDIEGLGNVAQFDEQYLDQDNEPG